jgi:tetratricopeptide (TPR) repeat protein
METLQIFSQPKTSAALDIIKKAKECEFSYDLEAEAKVLSEVWRDFDAKPDFKHYPREIAAELYLVCGYFIAAYGRAKAIPDYQERGLNYLTRAIKLFERCRLDDKVAEARCHLALCYHYDGRDDAAEIVLIRAEECFKGNDLHPVYLRIQINFLIVYYWTHRYDAALELIDRITPSITYVNNAQLLMFFHSNAGGVYRRINDAQLAAYHLKEALRFAQRTGSERQTGVANNNLASFCGELRNFHCAEKYIDEAHEIFTRLADPGLLANALDSKANILLEQKKYDDALAAADAALDIFRQSKHDLELAEAYFTKIKILALSRLKDEAIAVFELLRDECLVNIGEKAVNDYGDQLEKLLTPALEFHCADEQSGIDIVITEAKLFFEGEKITDEVFLFSVPAGKSRCGYDVVVCVSPASANDLQVIRYKGEYLAGNLQYYATDELPLGIYTLDDILPLEYDETVVIGGIIGYCPLEEIAEDHINFTAV